MRATDSTSTRATAIRRRDMLALVAAGGNAYYLAKFFCVGPFVGFDMLFVHRPKVALPQSIFPLPPETTESPLYKDSGSGVGYSLNLGLRGAFDIAF